MDLFTLVARLGMDSSEYEKGVVKARGSFSELGNVIGAKAVAIGNMVSGAISKAVDIAADLGGSAIRNASDVAAEKAQFAATFGEVLQGEAEAAFKNIEKSTGVLSTRLKNVGTKAFSQFKGAGMGGVEALSAMEKYTNLAADAAAYYDISLEDADARLRSFLRGNTEAGDAIGLFTSESQRNSAAMETYKKKWKDLTEEQKQMLMLNISEEIYKQSGAIGQAKRESDSWTNVVGNLKEAWRQATGTLGTPIMSALTPIIQELTGFLNDDGTQTKFLQFGLTLANVAKHTFDGVKSFIDKLTQPGMGGQGMIWDMQYFAESAGKVAGLVFDNVIKFLNLLINGTDGSDDTMSNIGTFFSDVGTFIDTYKEPISALISMLLLFWAVSNPFGILIGALVALIANWKDVKEWTDKTVTKVRIFFQTHYRDEISPLLSGIAGWFGTIWDKIDAACDKLAEFLGIKVDPNFKGGTNYDPEVPTVFGGKYDYSQGWSGDYDTGIPGSAGGLYYARNNYITRLHEGEMVLTRREANARRAGQDGGNADVLAAIRELADAIFSSRQVMTPDGRVLGDIVTEQVSRNIAYRAKSGGYSFG